MRDPVIEVREAMLHLMVHGTIADLADTLGWEWATDPDPDQLQTLDQLLTCFPEDARSEAAAMLGFTSQNASYDPRLLTEWKKVLPAIFTCFNQGFEVGEASGMDV